MDASTDLVGYLDWPGRAQVFRLEWTRVVDGERKQQVRYGITGLPPEIGSAGRLLALKRGRWLIGNQLDRHADVALGEDASKIHTGQGPTIFAELRAAAISLLHRAGYWEITP